jgi:hypothetical protein
MGLYIIKFEKIEEYLNQFVLKNFKKETLELIL